MNYCSYGGSIKPLLSSLNLLNKLWRLILHYFGGVAIGKFTYVCLFFISITNSGGYLNLVLVKYIVQEIPQEARANMPPGGGGWGFKLMDARGKGFGTIIPRRN